VKILANQSTQNCNHNKPILWRFARYILWHSQNYRNLKTNSLHCTKRYPRKYL